MEPLWVLAETPVIEGVYAGMSTPVIIASASRKLRAHIVGTIDHQAAVRPAWFQE